MNKKIMGAILCMACFCMLLPAIAKADSDINSNEQRVIDAAIANGYTTSDGRKYVVTDSGAAALERYMKRDSTNLTKAAADSLISDGYYSDDELKAQEEKGYIALESTGNAAAASTSAPKATGNKTNGNAANTPASSQGEATTASTVKAVSNSNPSTRVASATTSTAKAVSPKAVPGSSYAQTTTLDTSQSETATVSYEASEGQSNVSAGSQSESNRSANSGNVGSGNGTIQSDDTKSVASNKTSSTKADAKSTLSDVGEITKSSKSKANSIWNAILYDTEENDTSSSEEKSSSKKSDETSLDRSNSEKSDSTGESSDESSSEGTDSKKSSEKEEDSTKLSSVLEQTLEQIEDSNAEKSNLTSYKMPSEKDSDMQIITESDSDKVEITNQNGDTVLSYTSSDVTSDGIEGNVIHIEWIIPLVLVLLFVSIVCIYVEFKHGYFTKMREEDKKPNGSIRGILSGVMTVSLFICVAAIFVGTTLFAGAFRSATVTKALENSSYYEYAYANMVQNTVRILAENNIDTSALSETLSYDEFSSVVKKQIQKQLSTLDGSTNISKIKKEVNAEIVQYYEKQEKEEQKESGETLTKKEKKENKEAREANANIITNSIMTNYEKYADFYVAHFIRQVKRDVRAVFQIVFVVAALTSVIDIVGLYRLYEKRYKGLHRIALPFLIVSLLGIISSAIVYFAKPYSMIYLTPEYMYYFALKYFDSATKTLLVSSAGLLIVAIAILGFTRKAFPKKQTAGTKKADDKKNKKMK